jgi:hypothetical protein
MNGLQSILNLLLSMISGHVITLGVLHAWNGIFYDFDLLSWATHLAALPFDVLTVAGFYTVVFGRSG